MYTITDVSFITLFIIAGTLLFSPFYLYAVYTQNNLRPKKAAQITITFVLFGAFSFWLCLAEIVNKLGLPGNLIVPTFWILPSVILFIWQKWFLAEPLNQKMLLALQIFRVIGGVFLIEMIRKNIPGIFAYPAGIGDLIVGITAAVVLVSCKDKPNVAGRWIFLIYIIGMIDFIGAIFFGLTSSDGPLQIFRPEITNQVILFPTGMIPLFLVPYAIFFHHLSILNYLKFEKNQSA